jgi:hypothetical protein
MLRKAVDYICWSRLIFIETIVFYIYIYVVELFILHYKYTLTAMHLYEDATFCLGTSLATVESLQTASGHLYFLQQSSGRRFNVAFK